MLTSVPRPVPEHGARGETARIYHEIRQTLRVSGVNLNFRTWAAFPEFFTPMWTAMQPVAASQAFESASDRLRVRAADLALTLPPLQVEAQLGDSQRYQLEAALALYHMVDVVRRFERLLPALILNVSLFASDRWPADRLRRSPFPPVEESLRWRSP